MAGFIEAEPEQVGAEPDAAVAISLSDSALYLDSDCPACGCLYSSECPECARREQPEQIEERKQAKAQSDELNAALREIDRQERDERNREREQRERQLHEAAQHAELERQAQEARAKALQAARERSQARERERQAEAERERVDRLERAAAQEQRRRAAAVQQQAEAARRQNVYAAYQETVDYLEAVINPPRDLNAERIAALEAELAERDERAAWAADPVLKHIRR
jgi:hypothetical protein